MKGKGKRCDKKIKNRVGRKRKICQNGRGRDKKEER